MKHISLILVFIFLFSSFADAAERCEPSQPPCIIMLTESKSVNVHLVTHVEVIERTVIYHLVNKNSIIVTWPDNVRAPRLIEVTSDLSQACRK